uniref:U1 small nuclear ribonucleoprotein 70 kDa-like n=1 Tax=Osmia lignaria TaxID=473952 RepID=UPI001478DAD6|nr:U1 small nuclear ribonucleoprotein 70 kDa-like [Osmia lignaria]XP_034194609.1 U1 small nuclear ribonucleoprotein 70 kDa-like [Osmia lignaria]XP_034195018.1 U1 small nuclear ribonucleoprotein 70 kDa-like [Osmia lignaria]
MDKEEKEEKKEEMKKKEDRRNRRKRSKERSRIRGKRKENLRPSTSQIKTISDDADAAEKEEAEADGG